MAAAVHRIRQSLLFFLFFLLSPPAISVSDSDTLLKFKKSFNDATTLDSWVPDSEPCSGKKPWVGVICFRGIITGLRLGRMGLSGKIDAQSLQELHALRTVSFTHNNFSGPIPEFNRLGALKAFYLTGNNFSGEIPSNYFAKMASLKKVWLSNNAFTGEIPISLAKLPHLIELHLENNKFSGKIPPMTQSILTSFNVSNNNLKGKIPGSLSQFNESSFGSNSGLCGKQLGTTECASDEQSVVGVSNISPPPASEPTKVILAMATLILVLVALVVASVVVMKRRGEDFDMLGRENLDEQMSSRKGMESSRIGMESSRKGLESSRKSSHNGKGGTVMGDLEVVNDEKGVFGLQDLMKAAAEVLGNGGLGSAYKAVMSSGVAVVVKRMRDMDRVGKDGFDVEMRRLGRLRHRNILTPLAYHFRKEEKLMVSEYIPKGSLLYLLHGDRGPSHAELDWPARLKIVKGIARGMGFLHTELASYDIPHGNLKSSNIFLGADYEPLLADYGFCQLVNPTQATQAMFAYKAPEAIQYRHVSPKCDVYCLGIVILEILTGKFPTQYLNNGNGGTDVVQWVLLTISEKKEAELFDPEIADSKSSHSEMVQLLHIGASCAEHNPEQRLDMKEAIRRIEEIHVEGSQEGNKGIQVVPSLKDGYADVSTSTSSSRSHASSVREGNGEVSTRRSSLGERRNGDSSGFAIS